MGAYQPEKRIYALVCFILIGSAIGWIINAVSPSSIFSVMVFFLAVLFGTYSLGFFIFLSTRRAMLFSLFITGLLLLRSIGLRHILYPILYAITLLSIEHMALQKHPNSD